MVCQPRYEAGLGNETGFAITCIHHELARIAGGKVKSACIKDAEILLVI